MQVGKAHVPGSLSLHAGLKESCTRFGKAHLWAGEARVRGRHSLHVGQPYLIRGHSLGLPDKSVKYRQAANHEYYILKEEITLVYEKLCKDIFNNLTLLREHAHFFTQRFAFM